MINASEQADNFDPCDSNFDSVGLYIHVPFCEQKCAYCDFFTVTDPKRVHPLFDQWLDLCLAELRLWMRRYPRLVGRPVETMFFGGGTPSLLPPDRFAQFIGALKAEFPVSAAAEVTLETQPATLSPADYYAMTQAGINRFSIGVQTFNERLLMPTARRHTVTDAEETLRRATDSGAAVSLDMICALPGQTIAEWQDDLQRAISFTPDHMSVYEMTFHAGTQYYRQWKRGVISEADDAIRAEMFQYTRARLTEVGYIHYEISNYARPGNESLHNRIYWTLSNFIGLGAGAHSYIGGHRFENPRSADDYARAIKAGRLFARPHDSLDPDITLIENLQMALRLTKGVNLNWLTDRLGQDIRLTRGSKLAELEARNWITLTKSHLSLTQEGQLQADSVSEYLL